VPAELPEVQVVKAPSTATPKFALPVHAIGVGEAVDDLAPFDAAEFARAIALS